MRQASKQRAFAGLQGNARQEFERRFSGFHVKFSRPNLRRLEAARGHFARACALAAASIFMRRRRLRASPDAVPAAGGAEAEDRAPARLRRIFRSATCSRLRARNRLCGRLRRLRFAAGDRRAAGARAPMTSSCCPGPPSRVASPPARWPNSTGRNCRTRAQCRRAVAAKLAAYDPGGAYSLAFGWSPFGLVYDADKAPARLGGAPTSWAALLDPARLAKNVRLRRRAARRARRAVRRRLAADDVDPARATFIDVKSAGVLLLRAKSGAAQLRAARYRRRARARRGLPRRGHARRGERGRCARRDGAARRRRSNSPMPRRAARFRIDALRHSARRAAAPTWPMRCSISCCARTIASANARAAGVVSAEDASQIDALKRLWPEGAFDDRLAAAIETEWTHLRAAK